MDMYRRAKQTIVLAIGVSILAPAVAYPLQFAPGTPSIIVLDGRTEPPISVQNNRAELKPRRPKGNTFVVSMLGVHILIARRQASPLKSTLSR